MNTILQDLRYGGRMLVRNPGFTLVAVFAIALGIGANTAIFSVVNAVLLRPLPYVEPDRLLSLALYNPQNDEARSGYGDADFHALNRDNQSFDHVAAFSTPRNGFNLTGGDVPEQVAGSFVTADFFEVLRVRPFLGRTFMPHEETPGSTRVAVVSYGFWQRRLSGDVNALNQPLTLNGDSYYVIGVLPSDFRFSPAANADLYAVMQTAPAQNRPPYYLRVIGRLKEGVSEEQARADVSAIASSVQQLYSGTPYTSVVTELLKKSIVRDSSLALYVLLGAVFFVLLIASVNVANLLLARATGREKEMAVRAALGASGWRLARQTLTESALLATLGGTLGLILAIWGVDLILAFKPEDLPRLEEINLDGRVLAFTVLISLISGLVFGIAPAIQSARANLNTALKEGGRGDSEGFGRKRLRSLLVVAEVALALMLLVGAGLMIRSFLELQKVDPGFAARNVLTMQINLPRQYRDAARHAGFQQQLLEKVKSLPGVETASLSMALPPNLLVMRNPFTVEGQLPAAGDSQPVADHVLVSPDYFKTFGVRLVEGRDFTEADNRDATPAIIINEEMARRHFPGQSPIGQKIQTGDYSPRFPFSTVVGVVADVKYTGLNGEPRVTLYTPYLQNLWWRTPYLSARTSVAPSSLTAAIRDVVWELDRDLPVSSVKTVDELLADSVAEPRAYTVLLGLFGAVALLLATVGIYGVMAYVVNQRRREIGIRMAMGAQRGDVLKLVVGQGMRLAITGVGFGLAAAYGLTRLMESLLYGISATDVATFLFVAALLTGVALLACYLPARRAARVDPMVALRSE